MNVLIVSGTAWGRNHAAALNLVQRAAAESVDAVFFIDCAAVAVEAALIGREPADGRVDAPVVEIPFERWLLPGHVDGGVLDEYAIRSTATAITPEHIVVCDARAHRVGLVESAFPHLRHAWFPLDDWHRAFVLVADDTDLLSLGDKLSGTFHCQPQMLGDLEIKRLTRGIMREALMLRWLGPDYLRFHHKFFVKYADRFTRWKDRREIRIEERR